MFSRSQKCLSFICLSIMFIAAKTSFAQDEKEALFLKRIDIGDEVIKSGIIVELAKNIKNLKDLGPKLEFPSTIKVATVDVPTPGNGEIINDDDHILFYGTKSANIEQINSLTDKYFSEGRVKPKDKNLDVLEHMKNASKYNSSYIQTTKRLKLPNSLAKMN